MRNKLLTHSLTFIAGAIFGAVCLFVWGQYQFNMLTQLYRHSAYSESSSGSRESMSVNYGRPLMVTNITSAHQYELTLRGKESNRIEYSWRSLSEDGQSGQGELYEKYERVSTPKGDHLIDAGSRLRIRVGDIDLEWSMGGTDSGWLYYDAKQVTISDESEG